MVENCSETQHIGNASFTKLIMVVTIIVYAISIKSSAHLVNTLLNINC